MLGPPPSVLFSAFHVASAAVGLSPRCNQGAPYTACRACAPAHVRPFAPTPCCHPSDVLWKCTERNAGLRALNALLGGQHRGTASPARIADREPLLPSSIGVDIMEAAGIDQAVQARGFPHPKTAVQAIGAEPRFAKILRHPPS